MVWGKMVTTGVLESERRVEVLTGNILRSVKESSDGLCEEGTDREQDE